MLAEVSLCESGPVDPAILGAEPNAAAVIYEGAGDIVPGKGESVCRVPFNPTDACPHEVVSPYAVGRRKPEPPLPLKETVKQNGALRQTEKTAY